MKSHHSIGRQYLYRFSSEPRHPHYQIPDPHLDELPNSIDLEPICPAVYDQLNLGSCTANALAALIQCLQRKPTFTPSRLMIYWGERAIEGTKLTDSGANLLDGIDFLRIKGICPEEMWPYYPKSFALMPPTICWAEATRTKIKNPVHIPNNVQALQSRLTSGFPVAFGFKAYESLESQETAINAFIPMPQYGEQSIGGHAVLLVGYDDSREIFKIRNSWGPLWGSGGYAWMPYSYLTNSDLASDFISAEI